MLAGRSGLGVLCVVLGVGMLGGCSAVEQVRTPTLATDSLADSVQEVVGAPVTVTCPTDIPIEAGRVTECTVSDGTLTKVLVVTQTDDQGGIDWEISEKDAPAN